MDLRTLFIGLVLASLAGFGSRLMRLTLVHETAPPGTVAAARGQTTEGTPQLAASNLDASRRAAVTAVGDPLPAEADAAAAVAGPVPAPPATARARAGRTAAASLASALSEEPIVANALAREALRFVGKDPRALEIWKRAIDDPALAANDRRELIEDLNDEGYDDLGSYTEADLELILARLDLIEQLMPLAMDTVNARAFTEAYKDLLGMLAKARVDVAAKKAGKR